MATLSSIRIRRGLALERIKSALGVEPPPRRGNMQHAEEWNEMATLESIAAAVDPDPPTRGPHVREFVAPDDEPAHTQTREPLPPRRVYEPEEIAAMTPQERRALGIVEPAAGTEVRADGSSESTPGPKGDPKNSGGGEGEPRKPASDTPPFLGVEDVSASAVTAEGAGDTPAAQASGGEIGDPHRIAWGDAGPPAEHYAESAPGPRGTPQNSDEPAGNGPEGPGAPAVAVEGDAGGPPVHTETLADPPPPTAGETDTAGSEPETPQSHAQG